MKYFWQLPKKLRYLLIVEIVISLVVIPVVVNLITRSSIESEFRVVYSLDRHQNDREIIRLIDEADSYVYFAIYYFSKQNIADALIRAKKRGLVVWGIMDRDASMDANKNIADELRAAGISVLVQKHPAGIMHLKLLVTDKAYASGSYNWTLGATVENDEVLEISHDDSVRRQYLAVIKKVLTTNQ